MQCRLQLGHSQLSRGNTCLGTQCCRNACRLTGCKTYSHNSVACMRPVCSGNTSAAGEDIFKAQRQQATIRNIIRNSLTGMAFSLSSANGVVYID